MQIQRTNLKNNRFLIICEIIYIFCFVFFSFFVHNDKDSRETMKLRIQCILRTRKGLSMMELNKDCMYCMEDERRDNLMIEIAKLEVSTVFLFKEQTYKGRCNVVYKDHVKELFQLDDENIRCLYERCEKNRCGDR